MMMMINSFNVAGESSPPIRFKRDFACSHASWWFTWFSKWNLKNTLSLLIKEALIKKWVMPTGNIRKHTLNRWIIRNFRHWFHQLVLIKWFGRKSSLRSNRRQFEQKKTIFGKNWRIRSIRQRNSVREKNKWRSAIILGGY